MLKRMETVRDRKLSVLMVGVHPSTGGGMWTVVRTDMEDERFAAHVQVRYLPTACAGGLLRRTLFSAWGMLRLFFTLLVGGRTIDLLHVHSASRGSFVRKGLATRMAKVFGKPVVFHLHGAGFRKYYQAYSAKKQARITRLLCMADRVVVLGDYWRRTLAGEMGVPEDRITVLPNAVPVPPETPRREERTEVIFLGEIGKRKGVFDLVDAVSLMKDRLPEGVRFVLYGGGEVDALRERIAALGLAEVVSAPGFLTEAEKPEALSRARLHVLPSYAEGLPMSILETMAQGIPNIATAVGAISDVLKHGENGLLVEPGCPEQLADAVLSLIEDSARLDRMSACAREAILEKFGMERHIQRLLALYDAVLNCPERTNRPVPDG